METQVHAAQRPAISRSIEDDLNHYLDAIAGATAIFRSAVNAYVQGGPDGAFCQKAKLISEQRRRLDNMQQKLEMSAPAPSVLGELIADMVDPMIRVSDLLAHMKRQITGFAIETTVSGPGRQVPSYLVPDVHELSNQACAAVDALMEKYRPNTLWWEKSSTGDAEQGLSRHEGEADRLSMQLLKKIFADDKLDIETTLRLAQLVEEIAQVANFAGRIDKELRASRIDRLGHIGLH